jgi:hypothetical protein
VAAIKTAKLLGLGPDDVIVTVATDGAAMYRTEMDKVLARDFPSGFGADQAAATFERSLQSQGTEETLQLSDGDRERIFNLGYFTWVEQQDVSIQDFLSRKDQRFWRGLRDQLPRWDEAIRAFNARTGTEAA